MLKCKYKNDAYLRRRAQNKELKRRTYASLVANLLNRKNQQKIRVEKKNSQFSMVDNLQLHKSIDSHAMHTTRHPDKMHFLLVV